MYRRCSQFQPSNILAFFQGLNILLSLSPLDELDIVLIKVNHNVARSYATEPRWRCAC